MRSFPRLVSVENRSANVSERTITTLPLQGKRVLVTRTRDQASALSERLRMSGAIPVEFPTIRIVPPQDWSVLDAALKRLYTRSDSWSSHCRHPGTLWYDC